MGLGRASENSCKSGATLWEMPGQNPADNDCITKHHPAPATWSLFLIDLAGITHSTGNDNASFSCIFMASEGIVSLSYAALRPSGVLTTPSSVRQASQHAGKRYLDDVTVPNFCRVSGLDADPTPRVPTRLSVGDGAEPSLMRTYLSPDPTVPCPALPYGQAKPTIKMFLNPGILGRALDVGQSSTRISPFAFTDCKPKTSWPD